MGIISSELLLCHVALPCHNATRRDHICTLCQLSRSQDAPMHGICWLPSHACPGWSWTMQMQAWRRTRRCAIPAFADGRARARLRAALSCDFTALSCPVPSANGHRILEEKHPDIITCAGSRELGLPATGVFKDVRSAIPVSRKTYSSTGSCLLSILMQSCPVARIQTLPSYRVGAAQPCKASSTVQTLLVHQRRVMHERRRRS